MHKVLGINQDAALHDGKKLGIFRTGEINVYQPQKGSSCNGQNKVEPVENKVSNMFW